MGKFFFYMGIPICFLHINASRPACRSAMMTIMKMLKLLLMASAYGLIVQVVQDMKNKQVGSPFVLLPHLKHNLRFPMRGTRQPWSCRQRCRTLFL